MMMSSFETFRCTIVIVVKGPKTKPLFFRVKAPHVVLSRVLATTSRTTARRMTTTTTTRAWRAQRKHTKSLHTHHYYSWGMNFWNMKPYTSLLGFIV